MVNDHGDGHGGRGEELSSVWDCYKPICHECLGTGFWGKRKFHFSRMNTQEYNDWVGCLCVNNKRYLGNLRE